MDIARVFSLSCHRNCVAARAGREGFEWRLDIFGFSFPKRAFDEFSAERREQNVTGESGSPRFALPLALPIRFVSLYSYGNYLVSSFINFNALQGVRLFNHCF